MARYLVEAQKQMFLLTY